LNYQDNHITNYNMDFRENDLPNESVQCVVTSPPYWGLRKYSGEQDLIWGDNHCEHKWEDSSVPKSGGVGDYEVGRVGNAKARSSSHEKKESNFCSLCGAWKGAYGLEPTPEMYVQHTIEILREIRRVLRKDGVVFWNIGDSYAGSGKGQNADGTPGKTGKLQRANRGTQVGGIPVSRFDKWNSDTPGSIQVSHDTPKANYSGLKPKDLCLIPFRVAISAQEDGWWVRSVIIWSKNNPMPESVTDRPTESHEYILMLTKSARYYWDADAVRRKYIEPLNRWGGPEVRKSSHKYIDIGEPVLGKFGATSMYREGRPVRPNEAGRNIRSVWEFPTQPYPEAHFAVFPEKLPELCIKAATPEVGCCSKCGAPWERVIDKTTKEYNPSTTYTCETEWLHHGEGKSTLHTENDNVTRETIGWQPTCKCNADKVPSIVLDPFAGAGTTLWVAKKLGRKAVGYEISKEYCELIINRNRQQVLPTNA